MGCNAALMTKRVIDNSFDVLTIQLFAVVQAIDYLKCQARLSTFTTKVYEEFRALVGPVLEDKPRYNDIQIIRKYLVNLGASFPIN